MRSMIALSKRTDYALMAIAHLCECSDGRAVPARDIAERYAIPAELLAKILQKLARAGVLSSTAGPSGGYSLAVPARNLSVGAVMVAVEGAPAVAQCLRDGDASCEQLQTCTIRGRLARINAGVVRLLHSIPVSEFAQDGDSTAVVRRDSVARERVPQRTPGARSPKERTKSI